MAVGSEGCVDWYGVFCAVWSGCDDCAGWCCGGFCFLGFGGELVVVWIDDEVVFVVIRCCCRRKLLVGCTAAANGGETS